MPGAIAETRLVIREPLPHPPRDIAKRHDARNGANFDMTAAVGLNYGEGTGAYFGDGGDADQFVSMSKEFSELDPIVVSIGRLRDARNEAGDLAELIADPETDAEMKTMAQEEFQELQ